MSDKNLVAQIGQIATKGKHKERFLFVGTIDPKDSLDRLFYLIEIDTPWVNGEKIKNSIVSTLTENWQKNADNTEHFESAIKKVNASLGELSQVGEHEWIGKLNAIIGLISGDELIFSQTGNIAGYLFRGNKISHITEKPLDTDEAHPLKTFVSIINGSVADLDKIVIANSALYSHLSLDRLRQIFSAMSYKDAIDEISKNLRRSKIKDVNLIVFDILGVDSETLVDEKPEIIFLDDIPDTPILHYSKMILSGLGRGAKATGHGAKKVGEIWSRSIAPKISEKTKRVGEKTREISSAAIKPATEKFSGVPRVNYFNKKSATGSSFFTNLKHFFDNLLFWIKVLLKPENRKYLYIVVIVLLLGVGFIKIQMNNNKHVSVSTQSDNLASLDSARKLYSKALDDLGLKKAGAKEKLVQARDEAKKATNSPAIADEAKNLLNQIEAKLDTLNLATRVAANASPTFSFSENSTLTYAVGANLLSISADGKIFEYDTRSKTAESYGQVNNDLGKVVSAVYNDSDSSLLILTDQPTVAKLDLTAKTISKVAIAADATWEKTNSIATYSSNIYLLDGESGLIWKHTLTSGSYSKGVSYITKQPISLKSGIGLAVDGNVWVLKSDGSMIKIAKSIEDPNFTLSGVPTPEEKITSPISFFTDQSSNAIYIIDKSDNRVLQFTKTGAYQKQYVLDGMNLTSFAVNEKLKKLWLVSDSKVFELDI